MRWRYALNLPDAARAMVACSAAVKGAPSRLARSIVKNQTRAITFGVAMTKRLMFTFMFAHV